MYAPAARGRGRDAQPPLLDTERWAAELGERAYLLVRSHPSERFEISSRSRWAVRDIGEPTVATDFLTASDLLISDYSSLIGDASLLEVPVILFQPDRDRYVNRLHGLYVDLDRLAPVATSTSDLVELVGAWLTDLSTWQSQYAEPMRAFAADHCGPSDGSSAARAVAALLDTEVGR
jgi:CDP-glycerol glycerophosphotransferase